MLYLYPLIVILSLINALAFWQRHIFFYLLAGVGDWVFGLYYAWLNDPLVNKSVEGSPTWVIGVLIFVLGCFCLVRAVMKAIGK
jgi:hypothetical protein